MFLRAVFVLAFVLLLTAPCATAQDSAPQRVSRDTRKVDLARMVSVLADPSGALTAAQVAALADSGAMERTANPKTPILRRNAQYVLWLKLEVALDPSAPPDWLVVVEPPVHDRDRLYVRSDDGSWTASADAGTTVAYSRRAVAHRDFVFPVRLSPGRGTTMLLRVQDSGATPVRVALWQADALREADRSIESLYFLYFGLLAGMLLYNFLLYLVVRDARYLVYAGFIASMGMAVASNKGFAAQYLWGDWAWLNSRATNLGYAAAALFSVTLTRQFLSTRLRVPAADRVMRAIAWVAACALVAAALLPLHVATGLTLPAILATSVMTGGLSILAVLRRWPGAGYFCAAWLSLHTGSVMAVAAYFHLVAWSISTPEALALGSSLEMILLSLALADRINEERRQKERAQAQTLAILQASQALGSETRLDRLHARLCEVMAGVAGATAVRFVLRDAVLQRWFLYGEGADGERIPAEEAGERGLLCVPALRLAETTGQALVVRDAMRDERFADDPAFAGASLCALLALPIMRHGALRAVLVLENRAMRGAFSEVALGAVEAVAGPLAVALENVQLYEQLEQRVAQQTGELRETHQALLDTARRAGKAEIATNVLHNVGNTLNSVNVSAHLMRTRLAESSAAGVARVADLFDTHQGDLAGFLSHDDMGGKLTRYLRELAEALRHERDELQAHLERLTTSVDHIKNVVATQQAHAGPSVLAERVDPGELVQAALLMADGSAQYAHVDVVTQVADIPPVHLDRTRAVQILVNLVTNARQAMQDAASRARTLTIRVEADGEKLRFQVSDAGCGIAPDHLGRIFSHGFTTRPGGHGFGLHSSALAANEMGGKITAHSDGPGQGATFILEVPLVPA